MANVQNFIDNVRSYLSARNIPFHLIDCSEEDEYDTVTYFKICAMSEDIDLFFAYRIFIQIFPTDTDKIWHGSMIVYVDEYDRLLAVTIHDVEDSFLSNSALYGVVFSSVEIISQANNTYRFFFASA